MVEHRESDRALFLLTLLGSVVGAGVGTAALLSRWFGIQFVPAVFPGGSTIPPGVAFAFILSAFALLIPALGQSVRPARTITGLLASAVALIGLLLLLRYFTNGPVPADPDAAHPS